MANKHSNLVRRVIWGTVFGVAVYAAIAIFVDARALADSAAEFPLWVGAGCVGLSVVNYVFRCGRWHYYLHVLGFRDVPLPRSALIFVAGLAMSITPGKVGEVLKSALLQESSGLEPAKTAPIVLAERLTDALGLVVIISLGMASFDFGRWVVIGTLVTIVGFVVVVGRPTWVNAILSRIAVGPLERFSAKLDDAYQSTRQLLAFGPLLAATSISTVSWGMEAIAFYWIVETLGGSATALLCAFIYASSTLIGGVSFLPGGIGATEGSMIGVLLSFGVFASEGAAIASTYIIRFSTLWFGVACGIIALMIFRLKYSQNLAAAE